MKICTNCVLPETFPGIRFDRDGVCNYCRDSEMQRARYRDEKEKYGRKFDDILRQHRQERKGSYDVIMAYSGGKDSSYTLKLLKQKYGLRALAVTFDHGFMSPQAVENIHTVTGALNVDLLVMTPGRDVLNRAFRGSMAENLYPMKSLVRASAMCNTCMHLVKSSVLKMAVQSGIPFIAYGWSPGQAPVQSSAMALNPRMIRRMQDAVVNTLKKIMGDDLQPFLMSERDYQVLSLNNPGSDAGFIHAVHPLAYTDYNEEMIVQEIETLGWKSPADTDANSTNCLLNIFASRLHLDRHGFHPYSHEIAGLVREGYMTREAGIAKLSTSFNTDIMERIGKQLGMP